MKSANMKNRLRYNRNNLLVLALGFCVFGGYLSSTATMAADDTVLANVNGKNITQIDLEMALASLPEGQRATILKDENNRRTLISRLVEQELLSQQASKEKLDQTKDYLAAVEAFKKQYLSAKVLEKNLADKLGESQVKKYYENNKAFFSTDQVHALHILLNSEEEAQKVLKDLKNPKADFQAIAEKISKDPTAKNNRGDLGYFTRDKMVPEFSVAAFNAKKGTIVGPVKTLFGYHIIKVVDRKVGSIPNYDEISVRVKSQYKESLVREYVKKLRDTAKVDVKSSGGVN